MSLESLKSETTCIWCSTEYPFQFCVIIVIQFCEKKLHHSISLITGPICFQLEKQVENYRIFVCFVTSVRGAGVLNQINSFDKWTFMKEQCSSKASTHVEETSNVFRL